MHSSAPCLPGCLLKPPFRSVASQLTPGSNKFSRGKVSSSAQRIPPSPTAFPQGEQNSTESRASKRASYKAKLPAAGAAQPGRKEPILKSRRLDLPRSFADPPQPPNFSKLSGNLLEWAARAAEPRAIGVSHQGKEKMQPAGFPRCRPRKAPPWGYFPVPSTTTTPQLLSHVPKSTPQKSDP